MLGEMLRDLGLDQAGCGMPVASLVSWEARAAGAIAALACAEATFSAEDIRREAGDPPVPNAMGAAIRKAFKHGLIRPAGFGVATRPQRHASILRFWMGAA